ncbi:MAG TPA: hypothetical protein VGR35_02120 [Tepidisphaeraceae bacterium]|nr:hypothetical protein [Tepidisphaeraceae bacterium]
MIRASTGAASATHLLCIAFSLVASSAPLAAGDPIRIEGPEQSRLDVTKINGGLEPLPGVTSHEVFRAPADGYTYNHHVDLACWKGRLYLGWNSCQKDEDAWPSREVYSTSADGRTWDAPKELFPQGLSTPIRMFFFHAPNGRMLAIAGLRMSHERLVERNKGPVVVREIAADHTLGDVFLLVKPTEGTKITTGVPTPPLYRSATDTGFVEACNQLLANRPFLEQQDYGTALGDRRMKWHDVTNWAAVDEYTRGRADFFGKGFSFFHRKDGALVGISKLGFVVVSTDEGETWGTPVRPRTLVTGGAKVWGQRTSDGRYALAYNPHLTERFPLVLVHGDDGVTFRDMRVVFGNKPPLRHPGEHKGPGPQYVRGISQWSSDGSWNDDAMWVCYSVNKEDIWISRIPVPIGGGSQAR